MRPIRTIAVLPTLLTLGNLVCGFFAIVVASRGIKAEADPDDARMMLQTTAQVLLDVNNIMISGWLIFLAMVFDSLDGYDEILVEKAR